MSIPPPSFPAGPPASPPPPEPFAAGDEQPPSIHRRGPRLVLAVAAALVLLVGSVAYLARDDSDPAATTSASSTTSPGEESSTTEGGSSTTVPPASEAEIDALVAELSEFVATARQLEFLRPVDVAVLDETAFVERFLADSEEDLEDLETYEVFYRALGLLEPGVNLADVVEDLLAEGVVGFYDPETEELVVRGSTLDAYVRQTLVHELVHALDDQHFELHRPEYDDADDEIGLGFTTIGEGNAKRIEERWLDAQTEAVRSEAQAAEDRFGAAMDLEGIPEILLFGLAAPYELGPILVGGLVEAGGERAVDAAFADPPTTSEQLLFTDLYTSRHPRVPVPAPPAGGEVVDEGVVGALFLLGLFTTGDTAVDSFAAGTAVQGWGGDWAVTWEDGDVSCVRMDVVGDTAADTDELEQALTQWAEGRDGAAVARVDGRVRLQSCTASGAGSPSEA